MNKIDFKNQVDTIDFQKEYEYDVLKLQTQGISFKRKLTYESTDRWTILDENNNKVRKCASKPSTIYITTEEIEIDRQFGNDDHILAYWGDNKRIIDNLLEEQIEKDNIKGKKELILIGDYEEDVHSLYAQYNSQYAPYRDEFPKLNNKVGNKINVLSPFRLEFKLADIGGEQYKALNDLGNSIIDGSAGTGKSTIAFQKLKYLAINKNISQNKMHIIVKNKEAISHFKTLLNNKELSLTDVKILEVNKFLNEKYFDIDLLKKDHLLELNQQAYKIKNEIIKFIKELNLRNLDKHFIILIENIDLKLFTIPLGKILNEIKNIIEKTKVSIEKLINDSRHEEDKFDRKRNNIIWKTDNFEEKDYLNFFKKLNSFSWLDIYKKLTLLDYQYHYNVFCRTPKYIWYYKNYFLEDLNRKNRILTIYAKEIVDLKRKIEREANKLELYNKLFDDFDKNKIVLITISMWQDILSISNNDRLRALFIIKKCILELKKIDKNQININLEKRLLSKDELNILEKTLKGIYFDEESIKEYFLKESINIEKFIILNYIFKNREKEFDIIIVDEAQDYTLVELELLRLKTKRIVLTGDIVQNIEDAEIKRWTDILYAKDIFIREKEDNEFNIYTLKHNFRQTYQLSNASYNFRQLLLDNKEKLEDIEKEYWLKEKEFNGIPYELVKIIFNQNMKYYIKEKIEYIKNRFTTKIPIVLIYKTDEEKEKYEKELSSFEISSNTEQIENIDIILVNIFEAKGKQFPIVLSDLDGLSDREIYLILTRGQFEVEFLSSQKDIENKFLEILYSNEWIEIKEVNFVKNKLNIKKDLNRNIFCEKCSKPFNNLNSLDQHMASKKHKDDWGEYFTKDEVKERLKKKKLIHNHEKGQLVKEKNNEDKKSKTNYDLDEKEDKFEALNLANEKDESENFGEKKEKSKSNQEEESSAESIQADLLEAKEKHQGEVKQIDILLEPNVVSDIDAYIKKVQEEYEKNIKNAPTTVTTHIVNKKVKIGRKETKWFLEQQYKGFCQICGFSFTKRNGKGEQYFELFDWFSEKITKQKVNVIQAGSSLCLCARCHSGVKYGNFTANLVDILKGLDVKKMSFEEFVSKISVTVDNKEIPECYDFIENDMYKVDIRLFNQDEFIFYTEEHFLHLFVMLRSRGDNNE
jgi:hypothetical protein